MKKSWGLVICSIAVLVTIGLSAKAGANDETAWTHSLTVSPAGAELSGAPGALLSGRLTVVNRGSESVTIHCSVSPYGVKGLDYEPDFTQLPNKPRVDSWVTLAPLTKSTLAPQALVDIPYTVQLPQNAVPGSYYAVIFTEAALTDKTPATFTTKARVGHVLYITVNGTVTRSFEVEKLPLGKIAMTGKIVRPGLIIKDTGGVHEIAQYKLAVKNIFGKTVFSQVKDLRILPGTARKATLEWSPAGLGGLYTIEQHASAFGQTKTVSSSTIVVLDTRILLVFGLLLLTTLTFVIQFIVRRYRKHYTFLKMLYYYLRSTTMIAHKKRHKYNKRCFTPGW